MDFFFSSFVSNPLNPAKEMQNSAALLWLVFGAGREILGQRLKEILPEGGEEQI